MHLSQFQKETEYDENLEREKRSTPRLFSQAIDIMSVYDVSKKNLPIN